MFQATVFNFVGPAAQDCVGRDCMTRHRSPHVNASATGPGVAVATITVLLMTRLPQWEAQRTTSYGRDDRRETSFDAYEDIRRVLRRRRLWREEALQLVLTCLIVGGVYPRWGTHIKPTVQGAELLRRLHVLVFGADPGSPRDVFVDEFELPRRHEAERSRWEDWAVLWPDRLWMV